MTHCRYLKEDTGCLISSRLGYHLDQTDVKQVSHDHSACVFQPSQASLLSVRRLEEEDRELGGESGGSIRNTKHEADTDRSAGASGESCC